MTYRIWVLALLSGFHARILNYWTYNKSLSGRSLCPSHILSTWERCKGCFLESVSLKQGSVVTTLSQDFVWKIETRIQRLIQWSLMWASVSGMDGAAASVHACLFCDWEVSVAEDYGQVPEYISLLFNFISNLFTPATMWRSPWSLRKPQTSSEPTQMLVTHWAAAPAPPPAPWHTHTHPSSMTGTSCFSSAGGKWCLSCREALTCDPVW